MSDAQEPSSADKDRRIWVRRPGTPDTPRFSVSEPEEILSWKARIRDISRGGISLMLRGSFPAGSLLDIDLPDGNRGVHRRQVRVVRTESHDGYNWVIGCTFLDRLSEAELESLLREVPDLL
jgi:hypothetical protein